MIDWYVNAYIRMGGGGGGMMLWPLYIYSWFQSSTQMALVVSSLVCLQQFAV